MGRNPRSTIMRGRGDRHLGFLEKMRRSQAAFSGRLQNSPQAMGMVIEMRARRRQSGGWGEGEGGRKGGDGLFTRVLWISRVLGHVV